MAKKELDLADLLVEAVNKNSKTETIAFLLDGDNVPTNVDDWVSTQSSTLDLAVSNRLHGGLPVGRIVEFTGMEGTGKSLISAHVLAETQKRDGVAVLIDTESAVNREFFRAIGLDTSKLVYAQVDTVEEIFETIELIIEKVRTSSQNKIVTIVVDSVAAASTRDELSGDYDKSGYATGKAIIISKAMRKITNMIAKQKVLLIFTNQLRVNMNAGFGGDPYTTSGGKAIAFHSSVRIRLKNMKKIKNGDAIVGMSVRAQVVKNRLGPPFRSADFSVFFDRGIDDFGTWLTVLKESGVVSGGAGGNYKYVSQVTGEEIKFKSSDFVKMMADKPELKEEIYRRFAESFIMKYKDDSIPGDIDSENTSELDSDDF
jgi:recombination protein RecA